MNAAPSVETVPFAVAPNIFLPFGFIVNAFVSKLSATSIKEISSPTTGAAGNVTVIVLLEVSINNFCPLNAFAVEAVIAVVVQAEPDEPPVI